MIQQFIISRISSRRVLFEKPKTHLDFVDVTVSGPILSSASRHSLTSGLTGKKEISNINCLPYS